MRKKIAISAAVIMILSTGAGYAVESNKVVKPPVFVESALAPKTLHETPAAPPDFVESALAPKTLHETPAAPPDFIDTPSKPISSVQPPDYRNKFVEIAVTQEESNKKITNQNASMRSIVPVVDKNISQPEILFVSSIAGESDDKNSKQTNVDISDVTTIREAPINTISPVTSELSQDTIVPEMKDADSTEPTVEKNTSGKKDIVNSSENSIISSDESEAHGTKGGTGNSSVKTQFMLVPTQPIEPKMQKKFEQKKQGHSAVSQNANNDEANRTNLDETDRFQKDAFYVQIGHFSDFANAEKIRQQYEKYYPMIVEKVGTDTDPNYIVYIGPIKKDERGAVLETFSNYGFGNVFLRKTK